MKEKKKEKLDQINDNTSIAGIDIGKRKHYCRFINQRGYELEKVFSFKNNKDGIEKAVSMIENTKNQNNLSSVTSYPVDNYAFNIIK